MRNKIFILVLVTALALTACAGKATTAPPPQAAPTDTPVSANPPPSGEKVTLKMWSHSNPAFQKANELLIAKFMDHNPNIEVKFETFEYDLYLQNLETSMVALPKLSPKSPFVLINPWGLSIFISTPALLFIFFAPWREKLAQACLLGAVCVAIPSLLYYTTGYMQFGYRFILDYIPFLMVLVALGMRGRLTKPSLILILVSIAMGFFQLINFRASL